MNQTLYSRLENLQHESYEKFKSLSLAAKLGIVAWISVNAGIVIFLIIVGPSEVFHWLSQWAEGLREMDLGWLLLGGIIILTSIPPLFGYGTCVTLCGFAFGIRGWFIAFAGTVCGSMVAFILCRTIIRKYILRYLERQTRFRALGLAIRQKGFLLILAVRFCPFPFSYSNAFFASLETIAFAQFVAATVITTPKLLLHVWIGDRLYQFADPNSRGQMDATTKAVNALYIVFGSAVAFGVSYYIYRSTMQYVVEIIGEEDELLASQLADEEGDLPSDIDDLERRLVSEGHVNENYNATSEGRPSVDNWGILSDFGDDERTLVLEDTDKTHIKAGKPLGEEDLDKENHES